MKKLLVSLLVFCWMLTLTACSSQDTSDSAEATTEAATTQAPEAVTETAPEVTTKAAAEATTEAPESAQESKTLVVYFSNTGNTKAVAEKIAEGVDGDLHEIVAEDPYTEADLDYGDDNSRSTQEMNDSSSRPAISGSVENIEQYDTIYLGYPIWWGEAPRILDTFVESYDFTGKTVIPFCTSASSGMGSSADTLESLAGTGTWLDGERFSGTEDESEIMDWVNSL